MFTNVTLDTGPLGWLSRIDVRRPRRRPLGHLGPIAIGATIEITALCTRTHGPYSSWRITVHDAREIVGRGRMDFVVVHRTRYEARRLAPKRA